MDKARWREITALFEAALAKPRGERTTFLEDACQGDAELRREVENLLVADGRVGGFLEQPPAVQVAHTSRDASPAPRRIGKYKIVEKIGQGGFGEVFLGQDPVLRRRVAIKTCTSSDEGFRRRFLREAEIAGLLDHPNIVTVHDSGFEDGVPYLVQEFLPGEDLQDIIRQRRPVPAVVRWDHLQQAARGLEYAHGRGVIHRDVKPSNLRLTPQGRVKLLDFGIAKLTTARTQLTQTGASMGTIAYMAPEQLRGETVDKRADIFSFGVLAYELLSFQRPFEANSNAAMLYQILEKPPVPLEERWPGCPPSLAGLVDRCLEKEAGRRYQDFTSILAELETAKPSQVAIAGRVSQTTRPRPRRMSAVVLLLLATLSVLMVSGAYFFHRGWPDNTANVLDNTANVLDNTATGRLTIDAQPWAEVRIVTAEGREANLGNQRHTPLAISVTPGDYTVELRHPDFDEVRHCRVSVEAAIPVHCREEFSQPDAVVFFAQIGK